MNDRVEKLTAKRDELRDKMERMGDAGGEAFKSIQKDAEKLWKDTQKGFSSIRKEFKK